MYKRVIQRLAGAAGYEIVRKGLTIDASQRAQTVAELEALYRRFVFPDLRPRAGRDALIARLIGTSAGEALHIVEYLHRSLRVDGDVCEFGVAQGATSALLASEIADTSKNLWLFDSFEGLPKPTREDVLINDVFNLGSMERYEGQMAFGRAEVTRRLREVGFPQSRVNVVKGFIEETIGRPGLPRAVCFAYVDFDLYQPIKLALEFLDRAMPVGGHVIVDDYGWFSAGAQTAVDEFLAGRVGRWRRRDSLQDAGHFAVLERTEVARTRL
jgi:hypothetical protein